MTSEELKPIGVPGTAIDDKPRRGYIMVEDGDGAPGGKWNETWTWTIIVINRNEIVCSRKPLTEDDAALAAETAARELGIDIA